MEHILFLKQIPMAKGDFTFRICFDDHGYILSGASSLGWTATQNLDIELDQKLITAFVSHVNYVFDHSVDLIDKEVYDNSPNGVYMLNMALRSIIRGIALNKTIPMNDHIKRWLPVKA